MVTFEELSSRSFYERLISNYISKEIPKEPNRIWVSEVSRCLRYSYFLRVNPKSFTGSQLVKVFIGKVVHEFLEGLLKSSHDVVVEYRVEYPVGEFSVVGRADAVDLGGEGVIVEFKVVGEVPNEPYLEHVRQAKYYAVLTGVRKVLIVYISRDGEILPYIIPFTNLSGVRDELIGRAKELYNSLRFGRRPKPERGTSCMYCPYRFECLTR